MHSAEQTEVPATREGRSEWFLEQLGRTPIPAEDLKAFLGEQYATGRRAEGDELAAMLEEALVEAGRDREAIEILHLSATHHSDPAFAAACREAAANLLRGSREQQIFVEHTFAEKRSAAESLRRLLILLSLKEGMLCRDKTWGFGVVGSVDPFYKRVIIDFRSKPNHQMSLAYAAETLELLDDTHIETRMHKDPEAMCALVKEEPAKIVIMALESYGPMPVARLQDMLVPAFVEDGQWKDFWDRARKALKADPRVEVPAKRSEPLRVFAEAQGFDAGWFERLRGERHLKKLADTIETLLDESKREEWPGNAEPVLTNRLHFLLKGADGPHPELVARGLMLTARAGIEEAAAGAGPYLDRALKPAALRKAADKLSVRHFRAYLDFLLERHPDQAAAALSGVLGGLPLASLSEIVDALCRHGRDADAREVLAASVNERPVRLSVLNWAARNMDRLAKWELFSPAMLANEMLTALELLEGGDRSKERSQLIAQFENREWLEVALSNMSDPQRRTYLQRVKDSTAFSIIDRRSVLAGMIKLYPELEAELAATTTSSPRPQGRFSSVRSYEERRLRLEKIVNFEIPNNSKEIAVARSYGDLRENHEFKAAKEMQGLLLRRQAELEQMLSTVQATNFDGFPTGRVGMGTGVTIRYDDGRSETYYILGEWDRDEALGIISCQSSMAKALEGAFAEDRVTVPSETGSTECTVEEVTALPPEIRAWIEGPAEAP